MTKQRKTAKKAQLIERRKALARKALARILQRREVYYKAGAFDLVRELDDMIGQHE